MRRSLILLAVIVAGLSGLLASRPLAVEQQSASLPAFDSERHDPAVSDLREQAAAVDDLTWLAAPSTAAATPAGRVELLAQKRRLAAAVDAAGVARLNSVLAGEALSRAERVLKRWLDRRDPATDLFPSLGRIGPELAPEAGEDGPDRSQQAWVYGDSGADLYGHLAIAARFLAPRRYPELLETLDAERRLGPGLPDDVSIPGGEPQGLSRERRIFGVAEYAKDGLLPLLERVGPEPWLGRMRELADLVLAESAVPTRFGPIPADSAEINGDMLQVLSRLAWATGDPRYEAAAERIALAYLEVLPTTRYLPPHRWDFVENEPIERRRFRLSDHGNEVLSGLIEWHLGETLRGEPDALRHRELIRAMLDRLLDKGRNADGLWFRVVEIPSGRVEQDGLTDNWGYLLQAYLTAAIVEDLAPDGDRARAETYRQAARQALDSLPRYSFYEWQHAEMDGYADTIESAIYLLSQLDSPAASAWVDEQIPVLYGFQAADGAVLDTYLDGNFIRTTLLYAFSQTRGLSLQPWQEGTLVGAAPDGTCLAVSLTTSQPWRGSLIFDTPRHRLNLGLPIDYPRLNQWPEWFVTEPGRTYQVVDLGAESGEVHFGSSLAEGLPFTLRAGEERQLRVCRS